MSSYTPLAGKGGSVVCNGVTHALSEWSLGINADAIDVSCFSSPQDADGNYWRYKLAGLNGAELTVRGRWDNSNRPTAVGLRAGLVVTATCSLASGVAFSASGPITRVTPGTRVEDAATFEFTLTVSGPVTFPN